MSKMELKEIGKGAYYIPNPANIGVIISGSNAIMIDTGLDKDTARKALKLLGSTRAYAIINTHSHADHCGGNSYIRRKTGAKTYASAPEAAIIENPILEPISLFSGACPPKELMGKFLMAKPSKVDHVITEGIIEVDGISLKIVPLPGHSPGQIGVAYQDILFCGDSIFSEEILDKYKIPYNSDIDMASETLRFLRDSDYRHYIPSHSGHLESVSDLAELNLKAIDDVKAAVLETLESGLTTEEALKAVCKRYSIKIRSIQQHYLMNATILAYLSSLHREGKASMDIADNRLIWKRA